jgi:hypothetical protein
MEGTGKFIVTAVGLNSQNGIIFVLLGAVKIDKPLQNKSDPSKTTTTATTAAYWLILIIFSYQKKLKEKKTKSPRLKISSLSSKPNTIRSCKLSSQSLPFKLAILVNRQKEKSKDSLKLEQQNDLFGYEF